jgi:DNA-binding IclR family transcriptional regulator
MIMAEHGAAQRLLAELGRSGGTSRQLAKRAGVSPGYARELLYGLMAAGRARRWKQPGTRAFIWEARQ